MDENPNISWSDRQGLASLKSLLSRLILQWPNGPHDWQVEVVAGILDGVKQLLVVGCGEGKTAAAYLLLMVYKELRDNPEYLRYGSLVPANPVVLMVEPLSDLGISQVGKSLQRRNKTYMVTKCIRSPRCPGWGFEQLNLVPRRSSSANA